MTIDPKVMQILDSAQEGRAPSKADCVYLLQFHETSLEAGLLRIIADATSRRRFGNKGIVLGQIGVEIAPCPGKCKFCSFGEGHTQLVPNVMSDKDILQSATKFTSSGDLYALFLMTMHTFDFSRLINTVRIIRDRIPSETQIIVNVGDFDYSQALDLKAAGVSGAYHVCRLREGIDSALEPEQRKKTICNIKDSGMDWYFCCEPIGPEHTPEELVEQIYMGIEYGCFQHAAMRRVYIASAPLAHYGQISELRLAQVCAVVTLATLGCSETRSIAIHEPNQLGLTSGANTVYAETGANPRDMVQDTSGHRGRDINDCKLMLYEAGFESLLTSPKGSIPLTEVYK